MVVEIGVSRRVGRKGGVVGSSHPGIAGVVITVAAFAAAGAASAANSAVAAAISPMLAIGAAYLILAWLGHAPALGAAGASLVLLGLGLWLDGAAAERAAVVLAVAGGATVLATGAWYWHVGRSR